MNRYALFSFCLLGLFSAEVSAADPTYWQDIRPLLRKHCTVCHSHKNIKEEDVSGGLALDSWEAIQKDSSLLFEVGKATESRIYKVLITANKKRLMPKDSEPLHQETISIIKSWIDAGAKEGVKPKETESIGIVPSSMPRKRFDVILPLKATLPKNLTKPNETGILEMVAPIGPLAPITALCYSPNAKYLASGSYGRVTIWDLKLAKPIQVLTNVLGSVNDVRFSPDNTLLAISGGQPSAKGDLRIYSTSDWKLVGTLGGHTDVVASIAFSPDSSLLVSASFDKTVRIWDLQTQQVLQIFTGHSDFVYSVAFGPKGEWFTTASKDRTSRIVETKTGKSRLTFSGMDQDILAVAVKPDGSEVVTSGYESALFWWNTQTGERIRRQTGHDIAVHELTFSIDGKLLASAGADKTVRLWNISTRESLRVLPVGSITYSVGFSADGKQVASGSFDGQIRLWDTTSGQLLTNLFSLSGEKDSHEWLAWCPEGYVDGSNSLVNRIRWRSSGQFMDSAMVKPLLQPGMISKSLQGEKLPEPTFAVPMK